VTIFAGAFLLFQVQPMIGKYILPWFGSSPGVWTTCMLFFQIVLLGGYGYAHLISRRLKSRNQIVVHLALLAAAIALLPVTPAESWKPQGSADPRWQILLVLGACVGVPYFALSATGPLIQQWFSRVHTGTSPYRLYSLSNAGSLLALISYPLYFEGHFTRHTQASLWTWGLIAFAVCCAWCGALLWKAEPRTPQAAIGSLRQTELESTGPRPAMLDQLLWLCLPACASVLLLATTNKICQDVTVIPLLWVVPLALYLLSFVICFDSPRWYRRLPFAIALVIAIAGVCWALFGGIALSIPQQLLAYSAGLFVCCMVCHGEAYRLRPAPVYLTSFYLMIAAGGALGGIFVTLIAPLIFRDYLELHLGLVLCAALLLVSWLRSRGRRENTWRSPTCAVSATAVVALGAFIFLQVHESGKWAVARTRNFYGVLTVLKEDPSQSSLYCFKLNHGITTHGLQLADPALAKLPTTYYSENSGVGRALHALASPHRRIGVIGLGAGTLASYARAGDYLRMYEINPEVERLARLYFTYLTNCPGRVEVIPGDARLSLEKEPVQNLDALVMDAFTSDAIPMHLLTREAFAIYQRHLKAEGVIVIHISNRYLDLEPVIAALARHFNYQSVLIENKEGRDKWWLLPSAWVVLSRNEEIFRNPLIESAARPVRSDPTNVPLWTDDYASLYPILRFEQVPVGNANPAEAQVAIACDLGQRGDVTGAIAHYRRALELNPDFPEALNNLAWLLAASPDAQFRNGAEAVKLAERACELTQYQRAILLGTLAAAYAEAGRFDDAVATAEKAGAVASTSGDEVLTAKNRELLALYRSGKAYHESSNRQ
jgi:tetratricopeptide (TPR) repeat protein